MKWATAVVEGVRRRLGTPSPDPALVIDADLRPEGRQGPLVRTFESYRAYYARWSEAWETQALLRARPIAGDDELGRRFTRLIDPIRYPAAGLEPAAVTEIRRIKARVDTERLPRGADRSTHTKLGLGGLADVEWTVQLLQLQYAGDIPELAPEGLTCAGQPRLDRADRHAERVGDLLVAQAVDLAQHDHRALIEWQRVERAPQPRRDLLALQRAVGSIAVFGLGELAMIDHMLFELDLVGAPTPAPAASRPPAAPRASSCSATSTARRSGSPPA